MDCGADLPLAEAGETGAETLAGNALDSTAPTDGARAHAYGRRTIELSVIRNSAGDPEAFLKNRQHGSHHESSPAAIQPLKGATRLARGQGLAYLPQGG